MWASSQIRTSEYDEQGNPVSYLGNTLIPIYDNEDSVCGIIYNNTPYYFIKNLQGDVIAITNKNAAVVAKYSYDAWGVPTVTYDNSACSIATVNPYRYRSYYYDEEIAKYYLQSRYYDPALGRFINGDETLVDLFLNMSLSYAILRAIYEFVPASRKILIL